MIYFIILSYIVFFIIFIEDDIHLKRVFSNDILLHFYIRKRLSTYITGIIFFHRHIDIYRHFVKR